METSTNVHPRTMMSFARGAIVIAAGVVGWLAPAPTVATLAVLFGGFALLDAGVALALVFAPDGAEQWATGLWIEAVVSIGAGMLTLFLLDPQTASLAPIVAGWAVVTGAVELLTTRRAGGEAEARTLVGIAAGLGLGAGLMVVLRGSERLFLFQVAVLAFAAGITLAFLGGSLRRKNALV